MICPNACRASSAGSNVHEFPKPPSVLKFHNSSYLGKQCIVGPNAHVKARPELGPALPHYDSSTIHQLAGETLHSESFGLAISAVSGASYTLLMCHADLT
jgi:hypothetical protein